MNKYTNFVTNLDESLYFLYLDYYKSLNFPSLFFSEQILKKDETFYKPIIVIYDSFWNQKVPILRIVSDCRSKLEFVYFFFLKIIQ